MITGKRKNIRWFIETVSWATPENVAYFLEGRSDEKLYRRYCSELFEMTQVKNRELRLKRIQNQNGNHAFTFDAKLPTFTYNHDVALRNVLGKYLHDREMYRADEVSFKQPADANIRHYRFELDNGHMTDEQLEEKISNHYRKGDIQAVFIMRSLYNSEDARLKKIFDISEKLFYDQPNRILGACYSKFLNNGKLYNRKGEEK
jgi:hypothetical protein